MWAAVRDQLDDLAADGAALSVVDLGGGTGGLAVLVAERGHHVLVVEPSPDALAALDRRAVEHGVTARVRGVQGDAADLSRHAGPASAHLVLCHGVLEVVDDAPAALDAVATALRPGGVASIVVAGRLSAVLARAVAGDFARARRLLAGTVDGWDVRAEGPRRFSRSEVVALVEGAGLEVQHVEAVRVFTDLVPSALVDGDPSARRHLQELEGAASEHADLGALAGLHHVVARRGQSQAP